MADLDPANLHKLRVVDLKEILVKKGLSTSGLKAELVKRLRDALLNESPETQTEGQSPDADENLDKAYDNPLQSSDLAEEEMMQKRSWRQEGHEEPMDIDDDQQADSTQQELEDAAGRRMAEEHQRRMAEERQKRLAEAEEQKRIEEERQREEQQKFEEERQRQEQQKFEEEKQKMLEENQNEEQVRMEEERQRAEQMRIEEEKQREEQMRIEEQKQREEQMRKEEERRREEQMRIEEERRREEQIRIEEERQREEQKRVEEERQKEKQKRMEEERRREEQRRVEEERRREEQRRMEEERRREEQRRMEEEKRREEQRRMEEERRREEQRRMEELRRKEELRRIEEERRREEQRLYAEEEKRKEECRLYLEEERRKEEQRLHAEEERRKEEQKKLQEAEIAKQQLAHQQKLLAEKEKIRLAEEQQRLLAEEQKRLMAEEQQRLLTEQQRLMAEEQQRLLVEEQQRILAEQQKLLAEQQQKRLAEQQQKLLIEQQQKFLGEQQQKMLAHQLTPPGLLPTSMPPPPPLQQFTQPPPAPPTSIVTTAIANAFPPPPPPALNNQTPSKEPDAAEKLSDKNEIQISDKDSISEQSEEIKLPHAVEKILALKNERAQQLGIDPDSVIETAVELKESTTKKTVSRGLVSIDEDEELEEEETNTKVKESRRRRKKKKKQKRSTRVQRPNEDTTKTETVKEKDVDIEYVQDVLDPSDPLYSQFIKIFEKFKLGDSDKDKANADASMEEVKQEPKLVDKKKPMDLDDDDDDDDDDERDEKKEEDKPKLSKRKLKKLSRMTVAELKQKVSRPELVEMHDVTAKDPVLLLHLKASRNTVPVPRHWCFKRKYLQGKRGIEKPAFELPDFIKRTGIMEMRQALQEKEDQKTMKAKMRERVRPKLGKIDIDYQKLHDAFFKWQTKPKMTIHGDLYYEGKEFETRLKEKKPGDLNDDLRIALGMPTGPNANKCPPPWLIAMQRYGPPPSYPNLKIPGLNAPIPDACSFGYHAGGWGKPPVDEQGRPLYGDVFGTLNADDQPHIAEEEIDHTKWGELESESSEEEEEDEDEDEEEEEQKGEDETGLVTPAEGLITPSGFSSIPAGMETPDMIELRKRKIEAEMEGGETPALYTILPEKKSEKVGASMMGSTHIYDLAAAIPAAKIKAPGTTSVPPQGIEVALDPSELEMDTAAMAARYEQTMREQQSQLEKEDLSDMVAEHAARQKTKRKKLQQDSGKAPKKYKEFKF